MSQSIYIIDLSGSSLALPKSIEDFGEILKALESVRSAPNLKFAELGQAVADADPESSWPGGSPANEAKNVCRPVWNLGLPYDNVVRARRQVADAATRLA